MSNKEIARQFNLLAALMELHGENAFKTKAYANAYLALRKWDKAISLMLPEEISMIPGIGSSVAAKLVEFNASGKIEVLEKLKEKTPEGIQQLLSIKGLGPKKVRQIWDELKVESPAELLYACNENRLVKLAGFGLKTQEDLRQKIEYFLDSSHQLLYGVVEDELRVYLDRIRELMPGIRVEWIGEMATKSPVINQLALLFSAEANQKLFEKADFITLTDTAESHHWKALLGERFAIDLYFTKPETFDIDWASHTMSPALLAKLQSVAPHKKNEAADAWLDRAGMAGMPVEFLDVQGIETSKPDAWSDLIGLSDLQGIIHNHSTWSDGIHTLEEMAIAVKEKGYQYFVICDHSKSAFYANGLSAGRVVEQASEIDLLNKKLAPFKIYKGIESDILADGSLDYDEATLSSFDLIVASIHSNLRMDEEKAMTRLIKAIENPHTRILGHPTGRLLLARKGYPIDHQKIIDACAANGVAIELNANPLRLDIDYTWMQYCMQKEVWVSINPDAHSRGQLEYVQYGVLAARKGGLKRQSCLNALSLPEFEKWRVSR